MRYRESPHQDRMTDGLHLHDELASKFTVLRSMNDWMREVPSEVGSTLRSRPPDEVCRMNIDCMKRRASQQPFFPAFLRTRSKPRWTLQRPRLTHSRLVVVTELQQSILTPHLVHPRTISHSRLKTLAAETRSCGEQAPCLKSLDALSLRLAVGRHPAFCLQPQNETDPSAHVLNSRQCPARLVA